MSTAANLPPRSKRKSLRISQFGLPVPARISRFLDGPEVDAHDGSRAWGLEGWDADTKLKVKFASGRLEDIYDFATDGYFDGPNAKGKYLPIAAVGNESAMFAVDVTDPKLPVHFFDHESGFKLWADDFEQFLGKLLKRGEKTPSEKLEKAYEAAKELNEAKKYPEVLALLEPVVARFPKALAYGEDGRDELGAAYNLMGIAHEKARDLAKATECYQIAADLGTESAGLNICDLWLNEHKDYRKLVEVGEKQRKDIWAFSDKYAWFHIRNYLGQGYLLTGRPRDAIRAYHQIFDMFATAEPAKVQTAIDELRELCERPEADRATISSILAWMVAPRQELPAGRLDALRAWWPTIPEAARDAIKGELSLEGDPTDADFGRIAILDDLSVTSSELTDLGWVTMLDRLEEIDLQSNKLTDLAPLASLRRLRDVDVSENRVMSLEPLAALDLERLSAGENPLLGLQGLEKMHELTYLHVNEAGLESVEPLRGLRGLADVTIYNNRITDLSPLAESPRIKEISSFGNPIEKGLAELAALPWLESVDAGDETAAADVKALRAANPIVQVEHFYGNDDEEDTEEPKPDPELGAWWAALPAAWKKGFESDLDSDQRGKKNPSLESLRDLVQEDHISIDDTPLPDLEPMRRFDRVDYVNFANTGITDLSPLARLPRLRELIARDNKIDVASLAPARYLEELYIERCGVTSLAALADCREMRELHAEDNHLTDLGPVASWPELRILDLEGNRVTDLAPLANLSRLHTLKLGLNQITDVAPLARCKALRAIELWANPTLSNGVALADLPDLRRLITHGSLPRPDIDELRRRRPDVVID